MHNNGIHDHRTQHHIHSDVKLPNAGIIMSCRAGIKLNGPGLLLHTVKHKALVKLYRCSTTVLDMTKVEECAKQCDVLCTVCTVGYRIVHNFIHRFIGLGNVINIKQRSRNDRQRQHNANINERLRN